MLHGVLLMPPGLWSDSPIDRMQRHDRYKQASERIIEQEQEIKRLQRENLTFRAAQKACELCGPNSPVWIDGKPANVEAEVIALRKDLDDVLEALRHLRQCQTFPFVGDSRDWWAAAVEESDAVLARFDTKITE